MVKNSVYFIAIMMFMVLSFACTPEQVNPLVDENQTIEERAQALENELVAKLKAETGESSNARVQSIVSGHYVLTTGSVGIANYTKYFPSNKRIDFGMSAISPSSNNGRYITKAGSTIISEKSFNVNNYTYYPSYTTGSSSSSRNVRTDFYAQSGKKMTFAWAYYQ